MQAAATAPDVPLEAAAALQTAEERISSVIRGKNHAIRLCLTSLLARGHLLIEDIPGVGKTSLARALARTIGGTFRRIQFTSDLLPSDIVGTSVFNPETQVFDFRRGPIFANVVLADEINRTTPRTQSALLEAMSEGQVSFDDVTHAIGEPFLVVATQNPTEHFGTYPLPESQMDRFLLRIRLGYPSRQEERQILRERSGEDPIDSLQPCLGGELLAELQASVESVRVDDVLLDYAMSLIEETRSHPSLVVGVSTRGALAYYRAAQAHAIVEGRNYCIPDDFKELAVPALAHRVLLGGSADAPGGSREAAESVISDVCARIRVPT